jgi:hypothetical protein
MRKSSGVGAAAARMFEPGATLAVWIAGPMQALPVDLLVDDGWGLAAGEGDGVRLFDFDWNGGVLDEGDVRQQLGQLARIEGVVAGERRGEYVFTPLVEPDEIDGSRVRWVGRRVSVVHHGRSSIRLEAEEDAIVDGVFGSYVELSRDEVELLASQLAAALAWQTMLEGECDGATTNARLRFVAARAADAALTANWARTAVWLLAIGWHCVTLAAAVRVMGSLGVRFNALGLALVVVAALGWLLTTRPPAGTAASFAAGAVASFPAFLASEATVATVSVFGFVVVMTLLPALGSLGGRGERIASGLRCGTAAVLVLVLAAVALRQFGVDGEVLPLLGPAGRLLLWTVEGLPRLG